MGHDRPEVELVRHMAGRLTGEELQVLELLARGLTRPEVAAELNMSEDAVRRRITKAVNTLGCRRTVTAVAWLAQVGLIDPLEGAEV
jgi:DNA-binding NarL/FixJ family response regulator